MNETERIQRELISDFLSMEDAFEQYAYLIELSALLPPLAPEKKTEDRLVKGCQSAVWLDFSAENGIFQMNADSDTYIMKGVLYLLTRILNGRPLDQVAEAKITLFEETGLMAVFETDRQKGVGSILCEIRRFAAGRLP